MAAVSNGSGGTTFFASVYGAGVFKSVDNGVTWTDFNGGISGIPTSRIAANASTLFLGTYGTGVWQGSPSVLPVELSAFTASAVHGKVVLNWRTATEVNNYGFDIEKKNEIWQKIGYVSGHGTTNAPQSYSYADNSAAGKIVYRLKQIDRDRKFEYSKEVEVTIVTTPTVFALSQNYPNPFNPTTVINYSIASASLVSLKVFDMLGREILTLVNGQMDPGNYTAAFDASRLSSGVYFYRLDAGTFSDVKRLSLMK